MIQVSDLNGGGCTSHYYTSPITLLMFCKLHTTSQGFQYYSSDGGTLQEFLRAPLRKLCSIFLTEQLVSEKCWNPCVSSLYCDFRDNVMVISIVSSMGGKTLKPLICEEYE